jgi:hypothetical protein
MSSAASKSWVWGLVALCLVACGGKSAKDDDGSSSATAGGADFGGAPGDDALPPRGFYRKSVMTTSDTCTWSATAAGDINFVGTSPTTVAAPLGPSNLFQEVPWKGLSIKLPLCDTAISAHVLSRSSTSFVLDVSEDWPMPQKCHLSGEQIPATQCAGEWVETFKLLAACPTTVGQSSCD